MKSRDFKEFHETQHGFTKIHGIHKISQDFIGFLKSPTGFHEIHRISQGFIKLTEFYYVFHWIPLQ